MRLLASLMLAAAAADDVTTIVITSSGSATESLVGATMSSALMSKGIVTVPSDYNTTATDTGYIVEVTPRAPATAASTTAAVVSLGATMATVFTVAVITVNSYVACTTAAGAPVS